MYSNYGHYEKIFSNDERFLADALMELALDHMEKASQKLERLENITDFDTKAEYEAWKNDRLDYEAEYNTYADLVHALREAEEIREYIIMIESDEKESI